MWLLITGIGIVYLIYRQRAEMPAQWSEWADSYILIPAGTDPVIYKILSFRKTVLESAWKFNIDPALISGIIHVESEGNQSAVRVGPNDIYVGLMQIGLKTARGVGYTGDVQSLALPDTNIKYGTKYLKNQYDRYSKSIYDTISAYNAGHSLCSSSLLGETRICDNQAYVNAVYNAARIYRLTYGFLWNYNRMFPSYIYETEWI